MKRDKDTGDLFDGGEGRKRRDRGVESVKRANMDLMVKGLEIIRALPPGWCGQIEDIRRMLEKLGKKPTHPNFYGALGREAIVRFELLGRTGRRVAMRRAKSHARRTDELRRL